MKKGDSIDIIVCGHNLSGKAYGIIDNKKYFVDINCAKGQLVRGIYGKTKSSGIHLIQSKILDYNNRQNQMYNIIDKQQSGARYQYYNYDEQLQIKNDLVKNLIDGVCNYNYEFLPPIKSVETLEYRNKMEFSFGNENKDGNTILGLHKKNSFYDIIEVDNLKLMDSNFNKIYTFTNNFFKEYNLDFYHKNTHIGILRHLVLRKGNKQIIINLVTTSQADISEITQEYTKEILKLQLDNDYSITGILHTINDNFSDTVNSDKEYILYGKRDITENLCGLNFKISPYSFFQTNTKTAELLYTSAIKLIEKDNNMIAFDLFSGTGTIGQIISKYFKEVYCIEIVQEAVQKAIENAKINNITNIHFLCGDVFKKLDEIPVQPDIVILDPPRSGVGEKTIEKLLSYNMKSYLYISCNPNSLAEDIRTFHNNGYIVKKLRIVDMFPFTNHVECIALIQKNCNDYNKI